MNRLTLAIVAALIAAGAGAGTDPLIDEYLSAPVLPPASLTGDAIEPEITIIETEREIIHEYRIRGRLYMVRIDPLVGRPYYLFDSNGDGVLDVRDDRAWNMAIPQWLLFSW